MESYVLRMKENDVAQSFNQICLKEPIKKMENLFAVWSFGTGASIYECVPIRDQHVVVLNIFFNQNRLMKTENQKTRHGIRRGNALKAIVTHIRLSWRGG